jgi:hypothetical protein
MSEFKEEGIALLLLVSCSSRILVMPIFVLTTPVVFRLSFFFRKFTLYGERYVALFRIHLREANRIAGQCCIT